MTGKSKHVLLFTEPVYLLLITVVLIKVDVAKRFLECQSIVEFDIFFRMCFYCFFLGLPSNRHALFDILFLFMYLGTPCLMIFLRRPPTTASGPEVSKIQPLSYTENCAGPLPSGNPLLTSLALTRGLTNANSIRKRTQTRIKNPHPPSKPPPNCPLEEPILNLSSHRPWNQTPEKGRTAQPREGT